ncbi:ribose-5-phosphate isomerase RpiA [Oricola cellulosilytica]|uniref:Ribose-5-phosphate isomerase A n=1 Tax=Oricola cellulosilytica TaxID=1429082 RepID=A0A4R0P555_9HYPH|nr:ribose-5-phosphate isomerase RpiA [Oricola cellulosilytica]TCD11807.1 ribose-5-phosphate isomerase RpiA [Oricola cellulosilytica]
MSSDELKRAAAQAALSYVSEGMKIGIGTGSTAEAFIHLLAERVGDGFHVTGIPTSERSARLCIELGVPLSSLDESPSLDLAIDGADEIDASLNLIKGGGGALLREKIVAHASSRFIVIADESKLVPALGSFPLPIEVNPFGLEATRGAAQRAYDSLGYSGELRLRVRDGQPYETDGGHFILDASFGHISDPKALSDALHLIPGVVEHGLFIGMTTVAIVAGADGVRTLVAAGA